MSEATLSCQKKRKKNEVGPFEVDLKALSVLFRLTQWKLNVLGESEDVLARLLWSNFGKVTEDPSVESLGLCGCVQIAKMLGAVGEYQ